MRNIQKSNFKLIVKGVILWNILFLISGCGQEELQKLRSENEDLRNKVISLQQEVQKLKETADYHYQQGVDFFAASRYDEARIEFETVIKKYPLSPLVTSAEKQLGIVRKELEKIEAQRIAEERRLEAQRREEERRRQEEEKYRPRAPQEAISEWKKFRNNEKAFEGTVTTWRFQVASISYENPLGYLDKAAGGYGSDYPVAIQGPEGFTYQAGALLGMVPVVKEKDWIVVTGKFQYVSSDNVVVLSPIRIKNEGFK